MQPFLDSSTTADARIQPTDIQLLTTSILSNQERQRVILFYQEQLIDSEPSLDELRKSLLFLSSSSWGQILEERKLADKCSYPACSNAPPSSSRAGAGRGKFRINLRNKSVKAVEDLDLGEAGNTYDDLRDYFCSKACYARSEWILRWVLSDKEIGLLDASEQGNGVRGGGGGGASALGGKWQKLTSHPHGYEQVELLEDIEAENGLDFAAATAEESEGILERVQEQDHTVHRQQGDEAAHPGAQAGPPQLANLLGDLTIVERSQPAQAASTSTSTSTLAPPAEMAYTVDVPNELGSRFTRTTRSSPTAAVHATEEEEEEEETEGELARILRYASLATGSRPRPRNTTLRLVASTPETNPQIEAEEPAAPPRLVDPTVQAERDELKRIMHLALDVRRDQRQLGLLD